MPEAVQEFPSVAWNIRNRYYPADATIGPIRSRLYPTTFNVLEFNLRSVTVSPSVDFAGFLDQSLTAGITTTVEYQTGYFFADQDSWVPETLGCADNTNKNGTNLQVEGGTNRKDVYLRFPVKWINAIRNLAPGDILAADVLVYVVTGPTPTSSVANLEISNNPNTFDETTITCGTDSPPTGWSPTNSTSFQVQAGFTGQKSIGLTAAMLEDLRLIINSANAGECVMRIVGSANALRFVLQSKDSGGTPGNAEGPRLRITFRG